MVYIIGCDAHKHYSKFSVIDTKGQLCLQTRIDHEIGAIHEFFPVFRKAHQWPWKV